MTTRTQSLKRKQREKDSKDSSHHSDNDEDSTKQVKPKKTRVPKQKVNRSTEDRIQQAVGEASETIDNDDHDDNNNSMVDDEVATRNINTKRLLDARSKRAKRMDWEQGFFYLPKFDCYLPRHILQMIIEYIPPFPYFLNIRSISQQWLDEFDVDLCSKVKEIDLVHRYDIDYEVIKYKYPWYDEDASTIRNNDSIRFLALLFPNVEKLIVPGIENGVRLPPNVLKVFPNLQSIDIFFVYPTLYLNQKMIAYKQEITDIQSITEKRYLTQFSSMVMVRDENSKILSINALIPEKFVSFLNYLVKNENFSLKRLNILSLPKLVYSKASINLILEENEKQVKQGYGFPEFSPTSKITYITNEEVIDHMVEVQFFKNVLSPKETYNWKFISEILENIANTKICKMLFEQSNLPLVFEGEMNPILWIVKKNTSSEVPHIVEYLATMNPSLVSLGNKEGIITGNEHDVNILQLYVNTDKPVDSVIASLIKIGSNISYVCPMTGNNLAHIYPFSPSLIDSLPLEFIQMSNNKGYDPLRRLIKRIEVEKGQVVKYRDYDVQLGIEAFLKAYTKLGVSINDVKFENNGNLLHQIIKLDIVDRIVSIVEILISNGVDANAIDDSDNLPLFYFLEKHRQKSLHQNWKYMIDSISEESLSKCFNGKSLLSNVIERLYPKEERRSNFYGEQISVFELIENLLSRGCDFDKSLSDLSKTTKVPYEKDNLDFNKSCFMMVLLDNFDSNSTEMIIKIFKYFENAEEVLVKPCKFLGVPISPLMKLISIWRKSEWKRNNYFQLFYSENPVFSPKLLDNIIDIENIKIDALFYSIVTVYCYDKIPWEFLEGIFGVTSPGYSWARNRSVQYSVIAKHFGKYRYNDPVLGSLNIVQIAKIFTWKNVKEQIYEAFNESNDIVTWNKLDNEPILFENASSVLEVFAKNRPLQFGEHFIELLPNKVEWTTKHFRIAFENSNFSFCFGILQKYEHDFTKEEIIQIIIGAELFGDQQVLIKLLQSIFKDLTFQERFKIFTKRFNIQLHKSNTTTRRWDSINDVVTRVDNSFWSPLGTREFETVERNISLLDMCLIKGSTPLYLYIILNNTTSKQRKRILVDSELRQDILVDWLTAKCTDTGKIALHLLFESGSSESKADMLNDMIKYISLKNRNDIFNIKDVKGNTPLFYAVKSGKFIEQLLQVSNVSIQNNNGETVKDFFTEEQKDSFARFFKETTQKTGKTKADDEQVEEKPRKRTVRRKIK